MMRISYVDSDRLRIRDKTLSWVHRFAEGSFLLISLQRKVSKSIRSRGGILRAKQEVSVLEDSVNDLLVHYFAGFRHSTAS